MMSRDLSSTKVSSDLQVTDKPQAEQAVKSPYRAPRVLPIGSAVELVQGGRGRYSDANGSSFWLA